MTSRDYFDAWFASLGSQYEHIRPPASQGLSRRLLGFIDVDSATIRIGDPVSEGAGSLVICTGGDALYPVFGIFDDGELLEVSFACSYFWRLPEIGFAPLEPYEQDDLARIIDAGEIVADAESGEPHEHTADQIAAARRHIAEYEAYADKLRTDQIASVKASRRRLESLGGR